MTLTYPSYYNQSSHLYNRKRIIRCGGIVFNPTFNQVVIILNKDSYQRGEYKWGLPKGHIDPDESIYQCASREIKEETGLRLWIDDKTPKVKLNDTYYFLLVVNPSCQFHINDLNEIAQVKWFPINQLHKLNTNRGLKKFIHTKDKILNLLDNFYPKNKGIARSAVSV